MNKKILVTGSKGFVGKNLVMNLKECGFEEICEYDIDTKEEELEKYCKDCEFVFHLAGVNRPKHLEEFHKGNFKFTDRVLHLLKKYDNKCPIMFASSIQAELSNPYGESKRAGEELLKEYHDEMHNKIYIFRFPNLFGKWCRPNYNSVVATFCNNIAQNLEIQINDPEATLRLVYIDDVIKKLISLLQEDASDINEVYYEISTHYDITVGKLAEMILSFREARINKQIPYLAEESFEKKLYSTYLSYLPTTEFSYPLEMHVDERGSFTEILKSPERGQVSVNISKPGVEKGNHWHNTKCEKFCVVSGKALIQFRNPMQEDIISYTVSDKKLEVIDIPCGYTHNIINIGDDDLVTLMWCNECFDSSRPDTHFCKVNS